MKKFQATKIDISQATCMVWLLAMLILGLSATVGNGEYEGYVDADGVVEDEVMFDYDYEGYGMSLGQHVLVFDAIEPIDEEFAVAAARRHATITTTTTTTNAFDDGISCPSEQSDDSFVVLFASPSDCNVFYKCNRGVPYMIKCPGGLHYNPEIEACDFPARAKCQLINVI